MDGSLAAYLKLSNEVGDEVAEMGVGFNQGFLAVDDLLKKAAACKKPSDYGAVFADLTAGMKATTGVKKPKRSSPLDLHYKCVESAVGALAFVAVDAKSWETVQAKLEEMEFNGNKLLMQYRKTGPELYVSWHGSLKTLLTEMTKFAKENCPCGLAWNNNGGVDISQYRASADPRAAPKASDGGKGGKGMPTSSKGGKAPKYTAEEIAALKAKADEIRAQKAAELEANGGVNASDALFAELNALGADGGSIKDKLGLKKTVKGTAHERKKVDSRAKASSGSSFGDKGKKKVVRPLSEGYVGTDLLKLAYCYGTRASKERKTLTVNEPRKDAVLIMECEDVALDIVGVCKNISIAGCKRFNVSLEGSIGQVEVSNSSSGYLTINGKIFQLTCDKCEGLEVTLTPDAYNAKIVSSMCSSLNIAVDNPDKDAEMELLTLAVPTQYETKLRIDGTNAVLDTEAVDHNFG